MSTCHNHSHCCSTALDVAEAFCAKNNLRLTDTRKKVLEIIWHTHKAQTAQDIMQKLGNNQPPITYRALTFLQQCGFIHHIPSLNAYIGCPHVGKNHHTGQLLVCTTCREVTEIHTKALPLEHEIKNHSFQVDTIHIEVLGTCKACQSVA